MTSKHSILYHKSTPCYENKSQTSLQQTSHDLKTRNVSQQCCYRQGVMFPSSAVANLVLIKNYEYLFPKSLQDLLTQFILILIVCCLTIGEKCI